MWVREWEDGEFCNLKLIILSLKLKLRNYILDLVDVHWQATAVSDRAHIRHLSWIMPRSPHLVARQKDKHTKAIPQGIAFVIQFREYYKLDEIRGEICIDDEMYSLVH